MNVRQTILLISVLFFSACATAPPLIDPKAAMHMINIDRNGNFVSIDEGQKVNFTTYERQREKDLQSKPPTKDKKELLKEPNLDEHWQILEAKLVKHAMQNGGRAKVMLYIHGGLNTERHSFERVSKQYQSILDGSDMYPIFVNWRSGPMDSYARYLTRIRQGKKSNSAKFTSPVYLLSDLLASVALAPKSWLVQGKHSWDSTIQREEDHWEYYLKSTDYQIMHTGDDDLHSDTGRSLLWIATSPVKIITTPFTYTLPKPAWDIMMRRTSTMFVKPGEFENHPRRYGDTHRGHGALSLFLEHLIDFPSEHDIPLDITLVGHSMGTIICNEIVHAFPELNITTIVHMASADSIRNFLGKMVRFLETSQNTQFYALFLSPKNEDREISAWGSTPSGSLLTWIDNSFTTPTTELDRRAGRWSNMRHALRFIPKPILGRMHFKIFGQGEGPQVHGDFDEFDYWHKSFYWR